MVTWMVVLSVKVPCSMLDRRVGGYKKTMERFRDMYGCDTTTSVGFSVHPIRAEVAKEVNKAINNMGIFSKECHCLCVRFCVGCESSLY